MPLKIKELHKSDLDPNNQQWWSKDKIDKLNYNFNLLINGGMSGPAGETGITGDSGISGDIGNQGHIGSIGLDGLEGTAGASPWIAGRDENFITLFPKKQEPIEYMPVRVELGKLQSEQNGATQTAGRVLTIHNHDTSVSNIVINSAGGVDFHFRLSPEATAKKVELGKLASSSNNLSLQYDLNGMEYILHGSTTNDNYLLQANVNQIIFRSTDSVLGQNVQVTNTGTFKYNLNAIEDRLLVSLDAGGNSEWRNKSDVFGSLPIGSIISIPEEFFNNTNFYLTYDEEQSSTSELEIIHGRGRQDTPFEGWYLCNGQTWNDGVIQYEVPNLNQFDFNINSNGGDQEEVIGGGDNSQILIGGSDLTMQSTYQSSVYSSSLINSIAPDDEIILGISSGDFYSSRNVHIIYLKESNYKWTSGDITTIPTADIELSEVQQTAAAACSASSITYKWTGDSSTDWLIDDDMVGISLYNSDLTTASAGWYEREGLARYWSGTSFSNTSSCLILEEITLQSNVDVTELNGTLTAGNTYAINAANFEDATILISGTINAPAGWYRETNDLNGWRRYWNGTDFLGESFNHAYVFSSGILGASTSFDATACQVSVPHAIYYATDNSTPVGTTELHKISYTGGIVLVHLDWISTDTPSGEYPLVKIKAQDEPLSSSKYQSLVASSLSTTYRASITQSSTLNLPVECASYIIDGDTIISSNDSNFSVEGEIIVTGAPITLTLRVDSGTGGFGCETIGTLDITGAGSYELVAPGGQRLSLDIDIPVNGTFSYQLDALFGCDEYSTVSFS